METSTRRLYGLAANPALPADLLDRLIAIADVKLCVTLAGRDDLSPPQRRDLAARAGPGTRSTTAASDHAPADTPHDPAAEAEVADPATPPDVVAAYAGHPSMSVRWTLAARRDLPPETYHRLALDQVPGVRDTVAANPAIGADLMRTMAGDDTYDVRRRLAHNPNIPLDVLTTLARITRIGPTLLPRIATATPAEIGQLARSPVTAIRMLVAERPDLPPAVVNRLADDPDAKVARSLAPNPALTEEQLRSMVAAHGSRVLPRVARNPGCSAALLHHLATLSPPAQRVIAAHPNADAATLALCLRDPQARPVAARHPALPPATITALLDDPDERVAEAAAANPALPRPAMEALLTWHA